MTSTPTHTRPSETPAASPRASAVEIATAIWSVLAVAVGGWILADPGWYPLGPTDMDAGFSLLTHVPSQVVALVTVALGVVGIGVALAMPARVTSAAVARCLVGVGVVETLVFAAIVPDIRLLILMGYLCAIFGPVLFLGILVAGARGNRRNLVVVIAAAAAIGTGLVVFGAGGHAFGELGKGLVSGFAAAGPGMLLVGGAFLGGVLWLASTVRFVRRMRAQCLACGRPLHSRFAAAAGTWGRWVTIGAALCPLPYALLRMTWLTPWPVMMDAAELDASPEIRVFGLSLGFAALAGSVLTIGLISRWGEVFPRWIPVLRGRVVPAGPPAAVALFVAGAITLAGRSIVQSVATGEANLGKVGAEALLIFPFPIWGPLLGAAAIAYYLRRRGTCRHCAQT